MHRVLDRATLEATVHLLAAGLVLIGVGLTGRRASVGLVAVLLVATLALFAVRGFVPALGRFGGHDVRQYVADAWVATALAATTTTVALGASPGELQALGALLGLVAMLNYFLRPVYYVVYSLAVSALGRSHAEKN